MPSVPDDRKQQNKQLIQQLKQRLGDDGYRAFRQLAHEFASGDLLASDYRDECTALLDSATTYHDTSPPTPSLSPSTSELLHTLASLLPDQLKRAELLSVLPRGAELHTQEDAQPDSKSGASSSCRNPNSSQGEARVLLSMRFHHILDEHKRAHLVMWGDQLHLSGFSKPGTPGVVVVEGDRSHVYEYVKQVRSRQASAQPPMANNGAAQ